MADEKCCCEKKEGNELTWCQEPWIVDQLAVNDHKIPLVNSELNFSDRIGSWKARWGINRKKYSVPPGLYGVGNPTSNSPVLVTANYKMTFDRLRRELHGYDLFILVLDTNGINVWCAAGKGTFGTGELINRIHDVGLDKIVSHRKIILPQLGAPGVAAHQVTRETGFKAVFGPIKASDLPYYLNNNFTVTPEMRDVKFSVMDRLVLAPMELVPALKWFPVYLLIVIISMAISNFIHFNLFPYLISTFLGSIIAGSVLIPVLLPWIPFRAFTLKGYVFGFIYIAVLYFLKSVPLLLFIGNGLLLLTSISLLAFNFTGSTTYTSLSGVEKELKRAFPYYIGSTVLGIILLFIQPFIS